MQTLLIGLDGACWPVLDPLVADGTLLHLSSVFERGATGPLESQVPPWTASAWPSLYTGANPGKHGVFGFLAFDDYDWDVVDATHVREPTLWEILDSHGLSSVVVNAPVTYPPPEIDGAVLPGYVAPESPTCHPEGLLADVRDRVGDYRVYGECDRGAVRSRRVADFQELVRMRGEAFRYLCGRFAPAFGFLQFQSTDTVLHEHPDDESTRAVYGAVDEEVGAVIEACDPDTVIVASDHGLGEYAGHEFRVNDYLREHGFVQSVRGDGRFPAWDEVLHDSLRDGEEASDRDPGRVERAIGLASRVGFTSQRIGAVLERLGLADVVLDHVPVEVVRAGSEIVDFAGSRAYVRSRIECGVRINLEGREPDGVVPRDEYEAVRDEIIDALSGATAPDGTPIFAEVARREAYFAGPYAGDAVDVVTVPRDFDDKLSAQLHGDPVSPLDGYWDHKRTGVVAAAGAGVDGTVDLSDAHLFDVAPTVLATLGVPASDRMDGDPLPIVESYGERAYPPPADRERPTDDTRAVERRLAELGYLE